MVDFSKHTVLIVDDEIKILKSLNRGLHLEPYRLIFASSGAQALESFAKEGDISVIITDMRMPGMTGLDLLKEVNAISPHTVKIVLTGYTQLPQILATVNNLDIFKFLTKPWDLETELKVYIREAIEIYEKTVVGEHLLSSSEKKGILYNKMLSESYEKVDHLLRLYEELFKALNQHHIFSVQALREVKDLDRLTAVVHQMNDRVHYLNRVFELNRQAMKRFGQYELHEVLLKVAKNFNLEDMTITWINSDHTQIYYDNFKMITGMLGDMIEMLALNGSQSIDLTASIEDVEDKTFLKVIFNTASKETILSSVNNREKFINVVAKITGGSFEVVYDASELTLTLFLPIKKQPAEN